MRRKRTESGHDMSSSTTRSAGRTFGGQRGRRWILGGVAASVLALTAAAPAWAGPSATATLAPIGTGSYLLTVTNTGSEPLTGFFAGAGNEPPATNVVPSPACSYGNTPAVGTITCTIAIAPGASAQMCYTGKALAEELPGDALILQPEVGPVTLTTAAAVASCPLPGFKATSGGTAKCVVPKLKGKTLASAEKAIAKAHCAVGKVKKASSSHVKKGIVVSQGTRAGQSQPNGTKVSLVVSKG
jgi:PASTA domain